MIVLNGDQCSQVGGGAYAAEFITWVIDFGFEAIELLMSTDQNAGQDGGMISDTPAA